MTQANANANDRAENYRLIPLAQIHPSATNPRKHFDDGELAELASSIKERGVLQPILARRDPGPLGAPANGKPPRFFLVAGERRLRAAKMAGLKEIPCRVGDWDDKAAEEIQTIENDQRADLAPLERAEGYRRLIEKHGYTAETLAAKVGKSESTIRGLVKLCVLPELARKAMASGELNASTAGLIARLPTEFHRQRVTECVLRNTNWYNPESFNDPKIKVANGHSEGTLSYRETKALIERNCTVELKGAPFDRRAIDLVPAAGSCGYCPFRGGNLKKLDPDGDYAGLRADVCTNPTCYREKIAAHQALVLATAQESGRKVLAGKEAKEVFSSQNPRRVARDSAWQDLGEDCWGDSKGRTYQELIGSDLENDIVVAVDAAGAVHQLVPKNKVKKLLKTKINLRGNSSDSYEKKRQFERAVELETARRCMGQVAEAAQFEAGSVAGWTTQVRDLLRLVLAGMVDGTWADVTRETARRRGLKKEKGQLTQEPLQAAIPRMTSPELIGLMAELAAGRCALGWYQGDASRDSFWEFFKVDFKGMKATVASELKEKKAKPSKNGHKKPPEDTGELRSSIPVPAQEAAPVPGWKACPISDFEIGNSVTLGLLHMHGIKTVGDLDQALAFNKELKEKLGERCCKKLSEMVLLAAADDAQQKPACCRCGLIGEPIDNLTLADADTDLIPLELLPEQPREIATVIAGDKGEGQAFLCGGCFSGLSGNGPTPRAKAKEKPKKVKARAT